MTREAHTGGVMVSITEENAAKLLGLRLHPCEKMDEVLSRLLRQAPSAPERSSSIRGDESGYAVEVLGRTVFAPTLSQVFGKAIDVIADLEPSALERLQHATARRRKFIARRREEVHPGRPDLATVRTRSGWWISANVGRADVERALKALSAACSLEFGSDISFRSSR